MKKKLISLSLTLVLLLTFTACSSPVEYGLQITAIAPNVDSTAGTEYGNSLTVGGLPVIVTTTQMNMTSDSNSNESTDATDKFNDITSGISGLSSSLSITSKITSKEIDVMLANHDNAIGYANDDLFLNLKEIFTEEELSKIDSSLFVNYEILDDEGNKTGEFIENCGIDVSKIDDFSKFMTTDQVICHIVKNTENLENAKEYILSLFE